MGQNNTIALSMLIFSYFLYKRDRHRLAGIILGIAVSLKTIFGFFLLFYFLKRRWKVLNYALLTIGLGVIFTIFVSGHDWYGFYLTKVIPPLLNLSGREIYYNQGIMGFVSRTVNSLELRRDLNFILSLLIITPASYLAIKSKKENLVLSLFVTTLPLIDTLSWQHHFVWLIFPFITLSSYAAKLKDFKFWLLIGISYLLVSGNFENPLSFSQFPQTLLLSNQFYGTIMLWGANLYFLYKQP